MSDPRTCTKHKYARPPRAIRPRFSRSKLGCLACRIRRKKCDEQKPACKSCKRQRLICSWPNHESDTGHAGGFAWQINLKAGARVSKTPVAITKALPDPSSRWSFVAAEKESPKRHEAAPDLPWEMGCPGLAVKSPDSPSFSMLLEHYVKLTSPALLGRKTGHNPFLVPTLRLACSDSLVMHAVLAVSGIHCQYSTRNSDVLMATYKHYGTVLNGLKYALTHWVEGTSNEQTLNLLLVAILMCMYEALGGNENGSMSQHVRAAREFALHLIAGDPMKRESELAGILIEAYVYFATLAHLERRPMFGGQNEDPMLSTFNQLRQYETFGSYLGCAYQLYELIPAVSRLVLYEKHSISRGDDPENRDLYQNLRRRVASWSVEQEYEIPPATTRTSAQSAEEMAGMVVQNTLLMLLHDCRIDEGQGPGAVMEDIQPLMDDTMSLVEILRDEPVSAVIVWPLLIAGSMMVEEVQRQKLAQLIRTHHIHTALGEQIGKLLHWVWEDDDESTFGMAGLEKVAKRHKTHICYA